MAKTYGEATILQCVQGMHSRDSLLSETEQREIKELYRDILQVDDLIGVELPELLDVLSPDTLLERFAARKANSAAGHADFLKIKGAKG